MKNADGAISDAANFLEQRSFPFTDRRHRALAGASQEAAISGVAARKLANPIEDDIIRSRLILFSIECFIPSVSMCVSGFPRGNVSGSRYGDGEESRKG